MKIKAGVLLFLLTLLLGFLLTRGSSDFPSGKPGVQVSITVNAGESGTSIAKKLEAAGVIKSAKKFVSIAISSPRVQGIGAGVHRIESHIPVATAILELLDQKRLVGLVVVKEGSTYSDILTSLRSNPTLDCTKKLPAFTPFISNPRGSLEGELFPAQYSFEPKTSCESAIRQMIEKFRQSVTSVGLTNSPKPYEALTIASMVQIEGDPVDFGKVARTIYNRLKIGMPLQLNSTVQYAAHLRGRIAISTAATQIDSPYNTYKFNGLPPTPISNPSLAAISATLKPATGNWLYFITVKPGDTRFTNSYSEFSGWEVLYHQNLTAGAFK
jgi:UPF0755 protein